MPWVRSAGSLSDHTYQSRYGDFGSARAGLEPRVLVGGVVDDEVDDHADAAVVGLVDQLDEVAQRSERAGATA